MRPPGDLCTLLSRFCRGCLIDYTEELFSSKCEYIAIDWDPTAYYLRYQASTETVSSKYFFLHTFSDIA